MVQIEILNANNEEELVNDVNYFLSQLDNHLFIDIKYTFSFINKEEDKIIYSCLIIYRVE